ncbi:MULTISPECIES: SDR family NAD(P)-dependent oxidoreductase [Brachybacterium]|uniref:Short-chain dehydrogenase n=1 Tax=Brachybacterium alimentarium TaxID=47845 RepID=A0A2A3YNM5_9MICO|nr:MULTISPECIES: SDR family oxidoreductase [Brachybacterium]PCC40917.1 short-chain dehydrogenase [Brachybacterium alimentarium]RCS61072.1 SDR family NAD(P)-dependent oxidoreductase [Brachybacterium sp. JB7]RCS81386.1 SDR family NAD(P)-dependent oxidoreductase [Brachybacterium alimentarium]RCS83300.1 SDR family NAD(P)-dependent oxidoreductase [Brachybacterium alimentarium]RCS91114.1 SDR family NAD(P)-dependent oxidoreductase [Brachybacterium alimentarium]
MARALVTGSTSGLGLEFAWQLAGTGHDLVLVSRDEDRLRAVSEQIRDVHDVDVEVLAADLSDRELLEKVAVRLTDPVDRVDLLVNNAGYGLRGGFLEVGIEDHEMQMDTLMKAVLVLSHAAARTMVQRRRGAILNVSSLAGYTTAGPYAASKSWVTVFTEALAMELKGTGVTATALLPGFVQTEFHERAAMTMDGLPRITWLKAPFVVEQALKDTAKGNVLSIPSVKYRTAGEFSRIAPRSMVRALTSPNWYHRMQQRAVLRSRRRASRRNLRAPWQREGE